ncbi:hypothetical protein PVK06_042468 [Gossypium arboreum]|uniref:Uncharacterized protein n=1 Tax=Gossypium arboreum TaxID=29729 RepID=A0ABR0MKT3_GOSAR|nr:hypothetical protein PVK06_042468 [Gossypium arboreum]
MPISEGADGTTGLCLTTKQVFDFGIELGIYYKELKRKESNKDQTILRLFDGCKNPDKDHVRKRGLKVPQFPAAKYNVTIGLGKLVKKERELEEEEDPKEDSKEESKGEPNKAIETSDPHSD